MIWLNSNVRKSFYSSNKGKCDFEIENVSPSKGSNPTYIPDLLAGPGTDLASAPVSPRAARPI